MQPQLPSINQEGIADDDFLCDAFVFLDDLNEETDCILDNLDRMISVLGDHRIVVLFSYN